MNVKTTVFNLIILDESGSMINLTDQTISGCNETIQVARTMAQKNADSINSFLSIYAFQSGGPITSRYIRKNEKAADAVDLKPEDYRPWGNTPLRDAVGSTLSELKAVAATHEDATGVITIITDGYENASRHYSWIDVARLISEFKHNGWIVNLIGADIDINALGDRLEIDASNRKAFVKGEEETKKMWNDFSDNCSRAYDSVVAETRLGKEERVKARMKRASSFFKD